MKNVVLFKDKNGADVKVGTIVLLHCGLTDPIECAVAYNKSMFAFVLEELETTLIHRLSDIDIDNIEVLQKEQEASMQEQVNPKQDEFVKYQNAMIERINTLRVCYQHNNALCREVVHFRGLHPRYLQYLKLMITDYKNVFMSIEDIDAEISRVNSLNMELAKLLNNPSS